MILWLRHVRALPALGGAVVAAVVVRLLVSTFLEGDGSYVLQAPVWTAMVFVMPVMMLFTTEDDWDRIAVRSAAVRRAVLLGVTVVVAAVISLACFPGNLTDLGALAMLRNILALLGFGLLTLTVVPRWAGWVLPFLVGMVASMFMDPWPLTTSTTVLYALAMPGGLTLWDDSPDLSWWTCLVVFALGATSWLCRWRAPALTAGTGVVRSRAGRPVDFRRGQRRSMALPVVIGVPVVVIVWTIGVQLNYWGGSVRLLVDENFPMLLMFCMPLALAGGVVAGQYRWRSGVTVWESLSRRGVWAVTWLALRPVLVWLAVGTVVVTMLFLAVAGGGALADGVDASVVFSDLVAGLGMVLFVVSVVVIGGVVGVLAGLWWRGIWIAPVGLIIAVVAGMTLSFQLPARNWDSTVAVDDMECRDAGPDLSVCAEPRNVGYLDAAVTTVGQLYASSPFRDDLPQRVYLVDNGWSEEVAEGPSFGVSGQRGITAPDRLDAEETKRSMESYFAGACIPDDVEGVEAFDHWLDGMQLLFEDPADYTEWSGDPELTRVNLARAQACLAGQR